jgi:hypothetical protein
LRCCSRRYPPFKENAARLREAEERLAVDVEHVARFERSIGGGGVPLLIGSAVRKELAEARVGIS